MERRRDVDTASTPKTETGIAWSGRAILLIVASEVAGILVIGYGLLVLLNALPFWLLFHAPGTMGGPPANAQWWDMQFAHGLFLAGFGAVLVVGSALIRRFWRTGAAREPPSAHKALVVLVFLALGLAAASAVAGALLTPQRTVAFSASDFTLEPLPGNVPYENYFRSGPFQAYAGESLLPMLNYTLTDNRTGALVYWDFFAPTWYTSPSVLLNRSDPSSWAWETVVPHDGAYVLWVRYEFCATPGTFPCNNYTGSVRGELQISTPLAYEPWMLGLGLSSSVAMVAAVVQSGLGRRRTTSR